MSEATLDGIVREGCDLMTYTEWIGRQLLEAA